MKNNRINYEITSKNIDLIESNQSSISKMTFDEAMALAQTQELDLVEMAYKEDGTSVCKIMNYGKHLYQIQKSKSSNNKKSIETKEIRFTPSIGKEDYEIKIKKIKEFLEEKHKVLISVKMKGREREHSEISKTLVEKIKTDCQDFLNSKLSSDLQVASVRITCTLIPK